MTRIVLIAIFGVLSLFLVTGCAPLSAPKIIGGDESKVAIRVGQHRSPTALAETHCAEFGKDAVLVDSEPVGTGALHSIYYYSCR